MIFPCKFNLDKKCDYDNYKDCAVCVTEEIREEVSKINVNADLKVGGVGVNSCKQKDSILVKNEILQIIDAKLEEMK